MTDDPIRDAIQSYLDAYGDGWTLSHFVVQMGLERFAGAGIRDMLLAVRATGATRLRHAGTARRGG